MDSQGTERPITPGWVTPLYIRIGYGSSEKVEGPADALHYLTVRWPAERGERYNLARAMCADALERRASIEEAREAFIAAAIEAHVLS
jgi:hypothetical protein